MHHQINSINHPSQPFFFLPNNPTLSKRCLSLSLASLSPSLGPRLCIFGSAVVPSLSLSLDLTCRLIAILLPALLRCGTGSPPLPPDTLLEPSRELAALMP